MAYCNSCGNWLAEGEVYCRACGAANYDKSQQPAGASHGYPSSSTPYYPQHPQYGSSPPPPPTPPPPPQPSYPSSEQYPPRPEYYPQHDPQPPEPSTPKWVLATIIIVILIVLLAVVGASFLFIENSDLLGDEDDDDGSNGNGGGGNGPGTNGPEVMVADVRQGEGNLTEGSFVTLTKGSGEGVKIADYTIRVGKEGRTLIPLRWPADGNSSYSIDSQQRLDDDKWWDAAETMGFDAPAGLWNIVDGDTIEVKIKNEVSGDIVFSGSFTYRE
ncbi:MAG: hypothetical protein KAJ51_16175 [Thermoplasmata archaeon]|nr:hypothetical protein [Thermoplasmata archaeon]